MDDFYSVVIDKKNKKPIYIQLAESLLYFIESGTLKADSKLPAIRQMALMLKINTDTVIKAYKYLESKNLVYSILGSGTYVSPKTNASIEETVVEQNFPHSEDLNLKNMANFSGTNTKESLFPVSDFKKIFNDVLENDGGRAFSYQESQGYEGLRFEIKKYLKEFNIEAKTENIFIISSALQGSAIVARALLNYADAVVLENPGFYGALSAFRSKDAKILEVKMRDDGLDLDELEKVLKVNRPKLLYLNTIFHTPTGISYSRENKMKLLKLSEKYNFYIIEEDALSDFSYDSNAAMPLKVFDYKNRVIYIKSFSKILMPGIRLGFILLPNSLVNKVRTFSNLSDNTSSGFMQRAFALYMKENLFNKHREYVNAFYKSKYFFTKGMIDKHLSELVEYKDNKGGLSFWLKLKINIIEEDFLNALLKEMIVISPGSLYFTASCKYLSHFRLSFADVSDKEIELSIIKIKNIIKQLNNKSIG